MASASCRYSYGKLTHRCQNQNGHGRPWVPHKSDVLKQRHLQSFKTRRFHFAMDGKTQNGHGCP
ncbi:hypothetical protein FS559_03965 [Treponema phagedenis]|nr:hypothetical protein FS559_03965 [Treponema phagedenis]